MNLGFVLALGLAVAVGLDIVEGIDQRGFSGLRAAFLAPGLPVPFPLFRHLAEQGPPSASRLGPRLIIKPGQRACAADPLAGWGGGGGRNGRGWGGGGSGGGGDAGGESETVVGLHVDADDEEDGSEEGTCKQVFVTGASGSIGRWIVTYLLQHTRHRIVCLVRDPARLALPASLRGAASKRLRLIVGSVEDVDRYAQVARECDVCVIGHTSWGGQDAHRVNVHGVASVLGHLSKKTQVIYFSSPSLLATSGDDAVIKKRPLSTHGHGAGGSYISTKSEALQRLMHEEQLQSRLTVLYPTLVLGSHASRWRSLVMTRLLPALLRATLLDSSVHFIHARDAAAVACHLIDYPNFGRRDVGASYAPSTLPCGTVAFSADQEGNKGTEFGARHLVLAQQATVSLWARSLGGSLGGAVGFWLGALGAPVADAAMAGWSAIAWAGAGVASGAATAQVVPATLVSGALAATGHVGGALSRQTFQSAVNPETFGIKPYAGGFKEVMASQ